MEVRAVNRFGFRIGIAPGTLYSGRVHRQAVKLHSDHRVRH
jgi:hypothetical protein